MIVLDVERAAFSPAGVRDVRDGGGTQSGKMPQNADHSRTTHPKSATRWHIASFEWMLINPFLWPGYIGVEAWGETASAAIMKPLVSQEFSSTRVQAILAGRRPEVHRLPNAIIPDFPLRRFFTRCGVCGHAMDWPVGARAAKRRYGYYACNRFTLPRRRGPSARRCWKPPSLS